MNILGFIPARSGSTRVPNKNLKLLKGKPLIAYTILAAKQTSSINRIVVSTDSSEIAKTAKKHGGEVPFLRPQEISQSHSTELEFFDHSLNWFKEYENYEPDLIVLIYPTAPFRKPESIDKAVKEMLKHPEADSLRSVKLCSEHPYKMWVLDNGYLTPFIKSDDANMQTLSYQLFPAVYIQNACIYITKPATIRNQRSTTGKIIIPFIMDEIESWDINTPLDFEIAERLFDILKI